MAQNQIEVTANDMTFLIEMSGGLAGMLNYKPLGAI